MANFKRKKPRRQVKCTLCTPNRVGNSTKNKDDRRDAILRKAIRRIIKEEFIG